MSAARAARLLLALPLAWLGARAAEPSTLYVVEQLVVNVNSAPDASGERIATVKSGEALQVIEKSGEQVHVKLANGKDGWVRAGYLSADEPLRPRLAQRETEVAQLKDELTRLQGQLAAARSARP
ncbi:MAG TPA: TIGR04211 family SH3 domain-containing protein, partial [Steroidobacteraceae bacterium]|nr:TIGR04211 family SH3 domain-containing protein [Steroidobacteraceae bacterium]